MSYFTEFDPYLMGQRNREILGEVQALRLEERLRKNRGARGRRFGALKVSLMGMLHLRQEEDAGRANAHGA
jgi:hypothetical protein